MKVVIIGGVAGGATAAARIRRLDEQAEIIVFERSGFISYANCGLPYYIGGTIEDENNLRYLPCALLRIRLDSRNIRMSTIRNRQLLSVEDLSESKLRKICGNSE